MSLLSTPRPNGRSIFNKLTQHPALLASILFAKIFIDFQERNSPTPFCQGMTWIRAASNRSCLDLSCYRSCLIPQLKRLCLGPSYYKRDLSRPLQKSCLGQSCYKSCLGQPLYRSCLGQSCYRSYLDLVVIEGPSSGPGYPFLAQVHKSYL
jgi:hypothetical protein